MEGYKGNIEGCKGNIDDIKWNIEMQKGGIHRGVKIKQRMQLKNSVRTR